MRVGGRGKGPSAREYQFVTVVTYGRTGSTALQVALNALPGVLVRGENYSALRGLNAYVQAIAETADRHRGGNPSSPWFGARTLSAQAVVDDLRRHVVSTVLRPEADTAWLGFKEVRYEPGHFPSYDDLLNYLLFLARLFPGIRYVVNVRDPEAVSQSGWWPDNPRALEVLTQTRTWLADATADINGMLGDNRAVLVDYDAWTSDPAVLIEAFARIGLPRDDDAVKEALGHRLDHGPHGTDRG
jgi:hypothetical protein